MMIQTSEIHTAFSPDWRHVGAFLGLTFGLTWLLDLLIYLHGGLAVPGMLTVLQLQMMLPAFCAIVLGLFFFSESPIYRKRQAGRGRSFYYFYLALTLLFAVDALIAWLAPAQSSITKTAAAIAQILIILSFLVLVGLRIAAGGAEMARVWLSWGKARYWLFFGLGIAAYYVLQAILNAVTGLGTATLSPPITPAGLTTDSFVALAALQSVLVAPFLAIVVAFGEEFGWRGYLQTELFKLGRVRGVLVLGVIWGAWHWPIILMGYNYPGYPLLGLLLMALYTTGLAIVLGYAVLKSGSVLLSAYLHALNNQVVNYIVAMGFRPNNPAFSFDIGIYGIITLAIIAFFILRDPIWRGRGSSLPEPEAQPT